MDKELASEQRAISSFRGKAEKSSYKLKEGSWQRNLMDSYVKAADVALKLIDDDEASFGQEELITAHKSLADALLRAERAIGRFPAGSSQHTLQRNRIDALKAAMKLIEKGQGIS
ncbi:MAG TPA: hypothetical protein PLT03_01060 [Bacillota bacterium]|nr:hypothetical protein [Bacillota bacterium]